MMAKMSRGASALAAPCNFYQPDPFMQAMSDHDPSRLSPDELRGMADTSADPIIRRALEQLATDYEEAHRVDSEGDHL